MIPAIRLSEMYYIMGEYFAYKDEFSKAGEMLDKVRYARGISTTNLASEYWFSGSLSYTFDKRNAS